MSVTPIITFKAGKCDADLRATPPRIKPQPEPGFLYIYGEDELYHFCWRPRGATLANPELDLVMVPEDGSFRPYLGPDNDTKNSPVQGRVFVLKFQSSSSRHFFWLQSREQPPGQPRQFSKRDLRLGQIVNDLLQGADVDTEGEIAGLRNGADEDDDDTNMEDAPSGGQDDLYQTGSGGAGADATGGDVRDEGEEAREGGADGGRADMNQAVQNFLNSLNGSGIGRSQRQQSKPFTTLAELLPSSSTLPMIDSAEPSIIENLLVHHLPSSLVFLEHQVDEIPDTEPDPETLRASVQALESSQQKDILKRVLRSPQFSQGLMSLTAALRDGGLPSVAEALGVDVANGGYTGPDRRVPMSGGDAVEAFLAGIKKSVEK